MGADEVDLLLAIQLENHYCLNSLILCCCLCLYMVHIACSPSFSSSLEMLNVVPSCCIVFLNCVSVVRSLNPLILPRTTNALVESVPVKEW